MNSGCMIPQVSGDPTANSDGYERVIRVDEHGNVEHGNTQRSRALSRDDTSREVEDTQTLSAARRGSDLPHETRREDIADDQSSQSVSSPAEPIHPVSPGTSLSEQSNDFHNALAKLRNAGDTPERSVEVPPGVTPTVVHAPRFKLEYDDQLLGAGGIARVELYGTRDNGRTWQRLGEDKDRRSPYDVDVEEDGLYGFRIAVAGKNGLASRPPKNGELPELWVKVDRRQPAFVGNLRASEGEVHIADTEDNSSSPMDAPAEDDQQNSSRKTVGNQNKPAGGVQQANFEAPANKDSDAPQDSADDNVDWQTHLAKAIAGAQAELAGDVETSEEDSSSRRESQLSEDHKARLAAHLRMLHLVGGRHDEAIRNSPHHSTQENEYWSHQMHSLHLLTSDDSKLPPSRRSAAALAQLQGATDKLGAISELRIANLTFCTAAHSFGVYETKIAGDQWKNSDYREAKFEPEQPVVLYFEVNNFISEQHTSRDYPDGAWRTSLKGSYTILDRDGRPLDRRELQLRDDICRNRRHDYFVAYKTWMPDINPGHYTLELLIEDTIAEKIGTSTIDFQIVAQ